MEKGRVGRLSAPAGLFAIAFLVRALPWPTVLVGDRVFFFGNDAYYHMRRILYTLAQFPAVLDFDPYLNYPHGAKAIWTPHFDVALATLLLPFQRAGTPLVVERMVVWAPPVLGAACVVTLYLLARRYYGDAVALSSGLILSLLSGHFWYSQIGFVDHHAAVSLVSTGLLAAGMALVALGDGTRTRAGPVCALGLGALLGVHLLVWPGGLIHVALVEFGLLVHLTTRPSRAAAIQFATLLLIAQAVALLVVLPSGLSSDWPQWGDYSPFVLSRFQPWLFAALSVHALACLVLWRTAARGGSRRARVAQVFGLGAMVLIASALVLPDLVQGGVDAWGWFAKEEVFQGMVGESAPLLRVGEGLGFGVAELRLSRFVYLFPFATLALVWQARARPDRSALFLFAGWSIGLAAATLVQKRFFNSLSVSLALTMGWSLVQAYEMLVARADAARWRRYGLQAVVLAFAVGLFLPVFEAYRVPMRNQLAALRGRPISLDLVAVEKRAFMRGAEWLRDHTPATSGYLAADGEPEYGVLAGWDRGHLIKYVARRPTVVGNFGDDLGGENLQLSFAYSAAEEPEAFEILERLRVRYVFVRSLGLGRSLDLPETAMLRRLSSGDGHDLRHHRLVYEAPALRARPGRWPVRIFERVAGAELRGRAPRAERVTARLSFETRSGRTGVYQASTVADGRGRYALRLPYASGTRSAISTASFYTLEVPGRRARFTISEAQVAGGGSVEGPDLAAESAQR